MLEFIKNTETRTKKHFEELAVGDCYFDRCNDFCIKTNPRQEAEFNCIYYCDSEDRWEESYEEPDEIVTLADATITVLGVAR